MAAGDHAGKLPFELTPTDRENLAQGDVNFKPLTWDEIKEIIARNDLSVLKRKPSDLTRYIAWTNSTKAAYGSITNFVLKERLHWTPFPRPHPMQLRYSSQKVMSPLSAKTTIRSSGTTGHMVWNPVSTI
ncbi:hypothetical protein G7Y79_00008g023870 [Physcia stellaris]|nr:hypothetical protein G7Y79_00008g023870 [Physcia stellaris]